MRGSPCSACSLYSRLPQCALKAYKLTQRRCRRTSCHSSTHPQCHPPRHPPAAHAGAAGHNARHMHAHSAHALIDHPCYAGRCTMRLGQHTYCAICRQALAQHSRAAAASRVYRCMCCPHLWEGVHQGHQEEAVELELHRLHNEVPDALKDLHPYTSQSRVRVGTKHHGIHILAARARQVSKAQAHTSRCDSSCW